MVFAHVKNKKTGIERKVTVKSYQLFPGIYNLIGYVDEDGNSVAGHTVVTKAKTVQKKSVEHAVSRPKMTPEEIEEKKAELRAMNEAAIKKALDEQEEKQLLQNPELQSLNDQNIAETIVKERKKPGPKPKVKTDEA